MLVRPILSPSVRRPKSLYYLAQRPVQPGQPLVPYSEQEMLRRQLDAQTLRYLQSYASTLFDPGINPLVAERIQQRTGIDDTHFRTGMQTVGAIAGVPTGAYAGFKIGSGMGAKAGSIIPGPGTAAGTAIGAVAGTIIGAVTGFFTGKAIGGTLTPTGIVGLAETIQDRAAAFARSPLGGTVESLSMMGNTIDQLWGAPVVKAGILALQGEKDVWDQLQQSYGDHEDGFTRLEFSQIRKNTGLDLGGVGNGIVDFLGEMATDPGVVKSLFMGGLHRKATKQGQKTISQFASPGSATAAIGEKGQKQAARFVIDGIHNKQKALKEFKQNLKANPSFRKWWSDRQTIAQIEHRLDPLNRISPTPGVPITEKTIMGRQKYLSDEMDKFIETLYDGYTQAMLGDLPGDFTRMAKEYYQNKDASEELVGRINKRFGNTVDIHDNLVGNLNIHSQRFNKVFTDADISFLRKHYPALRRAENFDHLTIRWAHRISNPLLFGGVHTGKNVIKFLKASPTARGAFSKLSRQLSQGRDTYVDIRKIQGIDTYKVNEQHKNFNKKWQGEFKKLVDMENDFTKAREQSKQEIKVVKDAYKEAEDAIWDEYHRQVKSLVTDPINEARAEVRAINDTYIHSTGKYTLDKQTIKTVQERYAELRKAKSTTRAEYQEMQELAKAIEEYYAVEATKELAADQRIFTAHLDAYMSWLDNLYDTARRDFIADLQRKTKKTITITDGSGESRTILFDAASPQQQKTALQQWMLSKESKAPYVQHMREIETRLQGMIEDFNQGKLPLSLDEFAQTSQHAEGIVNRLRNHRVLNFLDNGDQVGQFKRKAVFDSAVRENIEKSIEGLFQGKDPNNVVAEYITKAGLGEQLNLDSYVQLPIDEAIKRSVRTATSNVQKYTGGKLDRHQLLKLESTLQGWQDFKSNEQLEGILEAYDLFGPDAINIKELEEPIKILTREYGIKSEDAKTVIYDFFNDIRRSQVQVDQGRDFNLPGMLERDKEPIKRIFNDLGIEYSPELERLQKRMDQSGKFTQQEIFANPNTDIDLDEFPQELRADVAELLRLDDDEKIQVIQDTLRLRYEHRYIHGRNIPQHDPTRQTRFKKDGGREAYAKEQQKIIDGTTEYVVNHRKKRGLTTTTEDRQLIREAVEELIGPTKHQVGDSYYRGLPYGYDPVNELFRKKLVRDKYPIIDIGDLDTALKKRVDDALARHTESYDILMPTTKTGRLTYQGTVGLDLHHLTDDELLEVVNRIYGQNFDVLSDIHKRVDYLDDAVRHDVNTSIHINGAEINQKDFIRQYGLESHRKQYDDIMNSDAGNYVKYKKVQRIQDSIARQFDYFQVNKDMIHIDYALNDEFNQIIDEFLKAFSGTNEKESSIFGLIGDIMENSDDLTNVLNDPEHPLTRFLVRLKNAKYSNEMVKTVVSDPKIKPYQNDIMAPMYDYLKRISNRDYLKVKSDGTLTWRSINAKGTWDENTFRAIIKDTAEIQKAINEQYLDKASPEVLEAMTEVYKNVQNQLEARYQDVFKNGLDSNFASTRLYGEVNANLINDMYKITHDFSRIITEAEGVSGRWGDPKVKMSLLQASRDNVDATGIDPIRDLFMHINELKQMLGFHRQSLRVASSHNNQLKRFLFTSPGTHTRVDTPKLFNVAELPKTGSPFVYRQSPYKREIVQLKKALNKHVRFDTAEVESLIERQRIMGDFPGDAATRLGENAQPEEVTRILRQAKSHQDKIDSQAKKVRNLERKRQTALHKEAQELQIEIEEIERQIDILKDEMSDVIEDLQMFPNVFESISNKHATLSSEVAHLISDNANPESYDIYTFLNMLDEYYTKPTQGSKFTTGRAYFQELLDQDPSLEGRVEDFYKALALDKYARFNERITTDAVKAAYGRYKLYYHDSYNNAFNEATGAMMDSKLKFLENYRRNFDRKTDLRKITGHYSDATRTSSPQNLNKSVANTVKHVPESQLRNDIVAHSVRDIPDERLDALVEAIKSERASGIDDMDFTSEVANELRYLYGGRGEWKTYTTSQVELKRLRKELMDIRDGGSKAPKHLRAKEQELQTQIRKLERVQDEGDIVTKFESEWIPSELEELKQQLKETAETRVKRIRTEKEQHLERLWNEHYKRYGAQKKSKYYKTANDAQKLLMQGDLDGFKKLYISAGGTAEEAAEFINQFEKRMQRFDQSPQKYVTTERTQVKEVTPSGKIKHRTETTKGMVDIDDATKVSDRDIINYKYEYTERIKEDIQETLAKKEFGADFEEWVRGADAPPTYEEFTEQFAQKYGADIPFVKQQNALEDFYSMNLDDAGQMFKDGQALNDFLLQHDEYILVATVPDSSAAAKTPTKYRAAYEGEKVHSGTRQIVHGPDHKIEVPFEKVHEGDVVLKDGRLEAGTTFDQVEEAAFLEGRYETNKPVVKKVMYNAQDLDDLLKSDSPIKSHIGIVTKDQYKTMARMSYMDYKLPPVLDYYFKNILRLQKQDMLLNSSWHLTNMIDVMRKNSQMMESIWDTKDFVEHLANAWTLYHTWDGYKKLLIQEKMELIKYFDEAHLSKSVPDATLAYSLIQDLKAKGMVGYVRENHTTYFDPSNIANPVFKGQHDPGTIVYRKWKNSKQFTKLSEPEKINFLNEKVDDFLNLLDEADFFQTSSATTDLPEFIRKMEQGELYDAMSADRWLFRHLSYENPIMRMNMKGGTIIEQVGRLHGYLLDTHLYGTSRNRAVANSLKRHFDYSDRSALELYATILFPFNAFPTRNALFWAEELQKATNSRRYYHFINSLWGSYDNDEHSEYAQYMKSKGYIPVGNTLIKVGDSRSMAMDMGLAGTQTAQNRLNPILRGAIDQLGKQERSMAEYLPLIRRVPQFAQQFKRIQDEGVSAQTLLPGLFGTIYRDHEFNNPVFRTQRNPYKQLFNQQGQYRQLSNNAYYRVRQIQNEQHRRRRL